MKPEDLSLAKEKIAASFKDLSLASNKLNSAADELTSVIADLEKLLKNLNLGVSAWHPMSRSVDEDGTIRTRDIGYASFGNAKWGIAIRKTAFNANDADYDEEVWRFADAPRWMCADAISHLPDLVQALLKRTIETTENIQSKTGVAKEILAATATAAAELAPATRRAK